MTDQTKPSSDVPTADLSEAERMAKIRELLVGPAIADESARVDQSVDRLSELTKQQFETITALQTRVKELEDNQRTDRQRFQTRLLGLVEVLLADERDIRARLMKNEILRSSIDLDDEISGD